jgi:hypothetical protein
VALAGIRETNSKGFWKPPGYGKSREFRRKSHSREIGKFPGNASKIGKFLRNRQIYGKKSANFRDFWGKSANFCEKSANFREICKFLGNVSKSPEIHFLGATFRDAGNDFPGEEVRNTGQKPPGHNPNGQNL